jgi:hypothetical protein
MVNFDSPFRVFWDVAPCIRVEIYRRFIGAYCIIRAMMEADAPITVDHLQRHNTALRPTRLYKHHTRRRENLKSHIIITRSFSGTDGACRELFHSTSLTVISFTSLIAWASESPAARFLSDSIQGCESLKDISRS